MPAQSLLNINPDKLFQDHNVSEIQETQRKLQHEIERKREELRMMVGERYRDLIKAADTITDMKVNAENVISHIEKMGSMCQELQQKHLVGFKLDSGQSKSPWHSVNKVYHSVAVQIKLLMDIPERIWTAVEKEDYLLGTQLFLFARHINTGLQLQMGAEESVNTSKVMSWFPVISRQWSTISHFRNAIISGCHKKLRILDLSAEETSSCLTACILLEGITAAQVLNKFLDIRMEALHDILRSEENISIREQICGSLKLLTQTIFLLHACFVEGSALTEGLVLKKLKAIVGRDSPTALNLLDLKDSTSMKFLPPVVQDFRPSTPQPVNPVAPSEIRNSVSKWLNLVQGFVQEEVVKLLEFVTSVKGLHSIREGSYEVLKQSKHLSQWDDLCQHLLIGKLNLWEGFFRPLLTNRSKVLVSLQLDGAVNNLKLMLRQAVEDVKKDKVAQPEQDLRWFVWREWSGDLPQQGGWLSTSARTTHQSGGLLMKAKGYTPCVQKLCSSFDARLEFLLEDLLNYLRDKEVGKHNVMMDSSDDARRKISQPFNRFTDKLELQEHLQACSLKGIHELMNFIKSEFLKVECEDESERKKEQASVVLMARFLQAVCDLCPHLQKCTSLSAFGDSNKIPTPSVGDSGAWQELHRNLQLESVAAYQLWRAAAGKRLQKHLQEKLGPLTLTELLKSTSQWDVVNIQEEGEEGHSIRSIIRVPSQPSLPLQSSLHFICQELNYIAPHTLPRKVHHCLVEDLIGACLDCYEVLAKMDKIPQNQALQVLLDVKFIIMLFITRDSKVLMGRAQVICEMVENKIDPFDLDVFYPYLQANVKKSIQRSQCLLGVLVPGEKMSVLVGMKASSSNQQEDPTVLPLSTGAPWFPLLPISNPTTAKTGTMLDITPVRISRPEKTKRKKSSQKPKRDSSPGGIVRSGAAAFFGAMSTDWFGS